MGSVDATTTEANQEAQSLDLNYELRRVVNDAYAFLVGEVAVESFAATTYEELAAKQNDRIEGDGIQGRLNQIERIERLRDALDNLVDQVKNIPPEDLLLSDSSTDVNTSV